MYSKPSRNRKKSKAGTVQIKVARNSLQLVFSYGGQRHYVSPGLLDSPLNRKLAQEKAFQIQRDIEYGEFDPTYQKYKVQSALTTVEDVTTLPLNVPSLPELWQRYRDAREPGKSPATVRMYGWVANHLDRCPHKLPTEAQAVFDWITANVPADSAKRVMMHLSSCCRWARKSGLFDSNPFEDMSSEVKVPKAGTEEDEVFPFTREERDRILAAFGANRYYKRYAPLMQFLFFTGCRPSEAVALRWKHVGKSVITFDQALIYSGKGLVLKDGLKTQRFRKFPINAQLNELIQSIKPDPCDPEALVFPSPRGKYIDWHNFSNRAWKEVLLSLPDIEYRNPYQSRHTFCSLCKEADIASIQIAKWVGNSVQMIDRVYTKPTDQIQVPKL
jgi:integrase